MPRYVVQTVLINRMKCWFLFVYVASIPQAFTTVSKNKVKLKKINKNQYFSTMVCLKWKY